MITFWHELPTTIEVVPNRKVFTLESARGKKVLHVGCVDTGVMQDRLDTQSHLHLLLMRVAERAWGVDVNREGIEQLQAMGVPDLFCANGEDLSNLKLGDSPDLIIAAEVLEHVSNPGLFLDSLRTFGCEILLTVPNAFSARGHICMRQGKEFVHEDHNYYFSYVTLKSLIEKHGFELKRCAAYYWPSNDDIGDELAKMIELNPLFAEGLIFFIAPKVAVLSDSRSFNVVMADADEFRLKRNLSAFLEAFKAADDVALHLPLGADLARMQERIVAWLEEWGLDPESIPDVVLLEEGATEDVLRAADLVVGSPELVQAALKLGKPAFTDPTSSELLEAYQALSVA